jgi:hypothetical protein
MEPILSAAKALLKARGLILAAGLAALSCLPRTPSDAAGQGMPLDDKARYERSLEAKVSEVLLRLLGPNQAQVVVQATMDFTRTEKVDMISQAMENEAKDNIFKWDSSSAENQAVAEYLLPGFPSMVSGARPENTSYQKQMLFPATFVKKLVVTVILNKELPETESQAVRQVVSDMLSMDTARGDELSIIRTPFAPFWRTVWYTPESMELVFKYGILTLMGIVGMVVVAVGFLKLAGAMNTMAKAQQGHQITMDLGNNLGGAAGAAGAPEGGAPTLALPGERPPGREGGGKAGEEEGKIVFDVQPDKVPFLVKMMAGEDPANVALVAGHLPEEVRGEFLKRLPPAFASDVIINMAAIRFVEPEVISTLKDELERRLAGAVGGIDGVLSAIGSVNLRAKRAMLDDLQQKQPELAAEVRRRVLLPDNLGRFSEKDFSLLLGAVKVEEWATAMPDLPEAVVSKIKGQMAEKTWQMVEQSMRYGAPSKEKTEEALEHILETAAAMIKDGKVGSPLEPAGPMIAGGAPAV